LYWAYKWVTQQVMPWNTTTGYQNIH